VRANSRSRTAIAEIPTRSAVSLRRILQKHPSAGHLPQFGASCLMASARRWRISRAKSALRDFPPARLRCFRSVSSPAPLGSSSDRICPSRRFGITSIEAFAAMRDTQACRWFAFHLASVELFQPRNAFQERLPAGRLRLRRIARSTARSQVSVAHKGGSVWPAIRGRLFALAQAAPRACHYQNRWMCCTWRG